MAATGLLRIASKTNGCYLKIPTRFASSRSQSKSVLGRVLVYSTLTTITAVGGTVAYANYDRQFQRTVNEYIPGFTSFVNVSMSVYNQGAELVRTGWSVIKPIVTPERGNRGIQSTTPTNNEKDNVSATEDKEATQEPENDLKESSVILEEQSDASSTEIEVGNKEVEDKELIELDNEQSVGVAVTTDDSKGSEAPPDSSAPTPDPSAPTPDPVATTDPVPDPTEPVPTEAELEDTKKTELETELRAIFNDFMLASDEVLASIQKVGVALDSHFTKIKESTVTPPDNESDINAVSESIGAMKSIVDEAYENMESSKLSQEQVSKKLSTVIAEALHLELSQELVDQICDKACEYQRNFQLANEDINKIKADHKTWQEELEQAMKKEGEKAPETDDSGHGTEDSGRGQLPLKDLDTQQEALLLMLRKRIEGMEEEEKQRLKEALSKQKAEMQSQFDFVLDKQRKSFHDQLIQMEQEMDAHYEVKIKDQLFNQAEAYSKHLTESLQSQADDLQVKFEEETAKKLSDQADEHHLSMAGAMAKLRGIQSVIHMVSEAGDSTRRLQNIRTASDSLTTAIITANNDPSPYNKHLINHEVESLAEAAQGDEFILQILSAIPQQAIKEGISSETGLVKRFERVRKICKRVALVGEEGAGLGTYLLSFIQSLLTIDMIYDKLTTPTDDIESMNTYRILSQANSCLERGDLEMAVRLVNQLKGEPRRVTVDWVKEACLYLETTQAVNIVTEYLAASCYTSVH